MTLRLRRLARLLAALCLAASPAQAGFVDMLATRADIGPAKVPSVGRSRILVIPVTFNAGSQAPLPMRELTRFFGPAREDVPTFAGYWRDNSLGRYSVEVEVAQPVVYAGCPLVPAPALCTPARSDPSAFPSGVPLVRDILTRATRESALDWRRYDLNGPDGKPDGYADGVLILWNGSHYGIAFPFGLLDARLAFEHDGVRVPLVGLASGPRVLGVALHEFGHLLGLADLYDEHGTTLGFSLSLMGNWNYRFATLPFMDAFSRWRLGWADLVEWHGTGAALMPPAETGRVYKLGGAREFFLAENRGPTRLYDRQLTQPGLNVVRVNLDRAPAPEASAAFRTVLDCPNCRRWHPLVMNVQADGRYDLQWRTRGFEERDLFHSGDSFSDGPRRLPLSSSNPWFAANLLGGAPSGVAIRDVDTDSARPFIRVTFTAPPAR